MAADSKKFRIVGVLLMAAGVLGCLTATMQAQQPQDYSKVETKTTQVADGIYVLTAVGGNIGVCAGNDGILLVDSQYAPMHQKIMEALAKISNKPIRFLIDTHFHGDHTDGNALMAKEGAVIVAHETIRARLSTPGTAPNSPPILKESLPVVTYNDNITLHFNGEDVYIFHPKPAHTDGDSVVYFRKANVMHVGDLTFFQGFAPVNIPGGFTIDGIIAAMEEILKVANPDTKFISGHRGPIMSVKDLEQQRAMTMVIRDRILSGIRAGKTVEEVVASKPTAEFDENEKMGRPAEEFVSSVYQDLSRSAR